MLGVAPTMTFSYERERHPLSPAFWRSLTDAEMQVVRNDDATCHWDRDETEVAVRAVLQSRIGPKAADAIGGYCRALGTWAQRQAQRECFASVISEALAVPLGDWTFERIEITRRAINRAWVDEPALQGSWDDLRTRVHRHLAAKKGASTRKKKARRGR